MPLDRDAIGVMRSSLRPFPLPDQSQQTVVTLGQVRPGPRAQNEYVDSLRPQSIPPLKNVSLSVGGGGSPQTVPAHVRVSLPAASRRPTLNTTIVASQPNSASPPLKKDPIDDDSHTESIICANCGKCRCGACTEPRDLPSKWLCGDRCEVSAEKAVECCTCFCCVKTVFYHCGQEEDSNSCYEDPCACCSEQTPHCVKRWTCMAVMSLCLPCLWCYWPARGCLRCCTSCYNRCRKKGCQCSRKPDSKAVSKHSQTRRLLIESDSSSA